MGDMSYSASIRQRNVEVAAVSGPQPEQVAREAMHYMLIYAQDGEPVSIKFSDNFPMQLFQSQVVQS